VNKEELLDQYKDLILTMALKGDELKTNEVLLRKWSGNKVKLEEAMKELNSCDALWMGDAYSKWFRENEVIQSEVAKRVEIIKVLGGGF